MVRVFKAGRGLGAWRARKAAHETEEASNCPAARTERAKRVCRFNDEEKWQRQSGKSDQLVVGHGKAQAPRWPKELTT